MKDDDSVREPHQSNKIANSSILHRHRYHHHHHRHHHQKSPSDGGNSIKSGNPSGNFAKPPTFGNIYDKANRNLTEILPHDDDEKFYSNLSKVSDKTVLRHQTTNTTSSNYTTLGSSNNRSLVFQRDFNNSSSLIHKAKTQPYYSHQEIINNHHDIPNNEYSNHISNYRPTNIDNESGESHFDVQISQEQLPPPDSYHNSTLSSLIDVSFDAVPLTPWSLSSAHIDNAHQLLPVDNAFRTFNVNYLNSHNITNHIYSQTDVHHNLRNIIPNLSFSTALDNELNSSSTNSIGAATADDLYTWSILMMAPLVVFGVTGNTLVILAISLEKRLQNVTNYFLLSLAVTDLLVSLIVMPFSIINVFTGRWLFGLLLCDFFVTSDVLMCTSSILHLCTISLERYIGIRYPLWTKNKSKRIVLLKIVFVWTIALAITSPITVLGVIKSENILVLGTCVLNNVHFIIYGSTFAFFIPLTIMVLMYVLTVKMLNKQARLCHTRRAEDGENQPIIRRSTSRRNWQPRRKYYGRETASTTSSSYSGSRFVQDDRIGIMKSFQEKSYKSPGVNRHNTIPLSHYRYNDFPRRDAAGSGNGNMGGSNISIHSGRSNNNNNSGVDGNNMTPHGKNSGRRNRYSTQNGTSNSSYLGLRASPEFSYTNGIQEEFRTDLPSDSQNCCSSRLSSSSSSSSPTSSTSREPKRLHELVRKHHATVKATAMLNMKRDNKEQNQGNSPTKSPSIQASVRRDNSVRTEQKASKVLGVVFMIFVICWAPFFTVNILTALCTSCQFEPTLITAFVWLGYVSSTLNPIIYTIFNNIFRITFIKLLCCRYRLLHRARRSSTIPSTRNEMLNHSDYSPAHLSTITVGNTTNSTFLEESTC